MRHLAMAAEIELKLLVSGVEASRAQEALNKLPVLAKAQRDEQWLVNRYFDTPDLALREARCALRVRRVSSEPDTAPHRGRQRKSSGTPPVWLQTFKTAGVSQGGLSQRGEWETAVSGAELDPAALMQTPWAAMDPEGQRLQQLAVCFETHCQRTTWLVRTRDGSVIEVALDQGVILAGDAREPMLELELELLAGTPAGLFALAQSIGKRLALLPCDISKAERGYALAAGQASAAARARPLRLSVEMTPPQAAQAAMGEMLDQLTRNLCRLLHFEEPELVHQARVAWRRWRSALRLFRPWLNQAPEHGPLRRLFEHLGRLRDLDVCATETLPHWAEAYTGQQPERAAEVQSAMALLASARQSERAALRAELTQPATGLALLALAQWLYELTALTPAAEVDGKATPRPSAWALERMNKLHRRLLRTLQAAEEPGAPEALGHEARLLAKRTRYSLEALSGIMPAKKARRWSREATDIQTRIGADRDLVQAAHLLREHQAPDALVAFLEGVAAGRCLK